MQTKIIFLDIDGVLLSGRALTLPANADRFLDPVMRAFDPCAIALINRLAETSDSKIVIHSNWRRYVGIEKTLDKLVEQGIKPELFHEDYYCPFRWSSEKHQDIDNWLFDHGHESEYILYLVIDDEDLRHREHHLRTDYDEGFSVQDYRVACGYLGGEDRTMNVWMVSEGDLEVVLEAWRGDRISAARWLHTREHSWSRTNARKLLSGDRETGLWGIEFVGVEVEVSRRRDLVLAQLRKDTSHLRRRRRNKPQPE